MDTGDEIVVRQYIKIKNGGVYLKYAERTYSGKQAFDILYLTTKPTVYGIKITLQQTSGTYRSFDYQFFRRRVG